MKTIKSLKVGPFVTVVVAAVIIAEVAASRICSAFELRFDSVAIGAVTVGLVVGIVAWRYDGCE